MHRAGELVIDGKGAGGQCLVDEGSGDCYVPSGYMAMTGDKNVVYFDVGGGAVTGIERPMTPGHRNGVRQNSSFEATCTPNQVSNHYQVTIDFSLLATLLDSSEAACGTTESCSSKLMTVTTGVMFQIQR